MFGAVKKFLVAGLLVSSFAFLTPSAGLANTDQVATSRLISSETLDALIDAGSDIQIIDIRAEKYVAKGTIPGAVSMPYKSWRGPKHRPGQPPAEADLEVFLGAAGIDLDRPILVFNHTGKTLQTGQAAYVYWLLKTAGAEKTSILGGGFKSWNAADLTVADAPSVLEPTVVDATYRDDWWADPMDIFGVATGQQKGAILDARLDSQVKKSIKSGKPMKSMPLARYIPTSLIAPTLSAKRLTDDEMNNFRAALEGRGVNLTGDLIISVCQTGELSALSWFYASEIVGIENVQYYPDALQGWQADGGLLFGMHTPQNLENASSN